jgi:TRAP-type mannitol/chloroaromatic compound transport system permease large subunit
VAGGLPQMLLNRRLTWPLFREVVEGTALMTAMVFFVVMAANVFSYPFRFSVAAKSLTACWGAWLSAIGACY